MSSKWSPSNDFILRHGQLKWTLMGNYAPLSSLGLTFAKRVENTPNLSDYSGHNV